MPWSRRHQRVAVRIVVAAGAILMGAIGLATANIALLATAGPLLGWAVPWLREVELDRALDQAIASLGQGEPPRTVEKRLRRVSNAPPRGPE